MVMKRNIMGKNLLQTIRNSLGRYIAIVAIIALGAGMFVGLITTKSDMLATADKYVADQNMFHLNVLNTYGWTDQELEQISKLEGIADIQGNKTLDVIARFDQDGEDKVYRLHSIPDTVDRVHLMGGRMPQQSDECLADGSRWDDSVLGMQFIVSETNEEDTLESLGEQVFTVVGYVSTPLYMDMTRGTTTIGNGSLTSYVYIPSQAFTTDYYTGISLTLPGKYPVYSEELDAAMEQAADALKPEITTLAQSRYETLLEDAIAEYNDGLAEYEKGKKEYEDGKKEAEAEFAKAEKELTDGQKELDEQRALLEDGEAQLADGKATLQKTETQLADSQKELADAKAEAYEQLAEAYDQLMSNYKTALAGQKELNDGLEQLNGGITQIETGLEQIASGMEQLELVTGILSTSIDVTQKLIDLEKQSPIVNEERLAKLEEELASLKEKQSEYTAQEQELTTQQKELITQLEELKKTKAELDPKKAEVDDAVKQIELGIMELESKQLQTENQFSSAEAKLESGLIQLEEGKKELATQEAKLTEGRAELEKAQSTLDKGRRDYEKEKQKAEKELAEAEEELLDAKQQLDDAKETIDSMGQPDVYLLDRNTNVGYLAVNSNSDIVQGVSKVFPAFFLLIAALVCITTLTKMVDEERTQIGVLKAMGYRNGAIVGKYLAYCGSAAIIGCGLGVIIGSIAFPKILWAAYSIILNLTPKVVLKLNWPLCLAVVAAYTTVSMVVTWICCRAELREVPAQLIRPKAPKPGKKILLEYLPFWDKISFLNKVMFRNVFRYRQRLLMTMVGVGGCTALLLTGFGIRDSIMDIVGYQFAEVTVYDMEVYFSEGQTPEDQEVFRDELRANVDQILFYHRTSVDLVVDGKTKPLDLLATAEDLEGFMQLHHNGRKLAMPGEGEILLTVGAAEAMGLREGDSVTIRNADLQELTVTVAGIFDNHVNNFLIILPETLAPWNQSLEQQMAIINVRDTQDVHEAGAIIAAMDNVMTVSISQDLADQVGAMLKALDLVVVTVVVCAALLAIIVLYNLTNISITERIREIATLKVLGFNARETAAYVFKENLFLSAMGSVLGLVGGIFLLRFVMSQIKIDMVWFQSRLNFPSYIWAILLTMLSACLVDFLLYFKLEKINMAEALKSVE